MIWNKLILINYPEKLLYIKKKLLKYSDIYNKWFKNNLTQANSHLNDSFRLANIEQSQK